MDSLKRFDETLFPDKENFYSNSNMENISDADYKHAQKVWKSFEKKNIGYIMIYMFKAIHYYLQMYLKVFATNVF